MIYVIPHVSVTLVFKSLNAVIQSSIDGVDQSVLLQLHMASLLTSTYCCEIDNELST